MVDAQQVQHRGVEVVDVDAVADDVVAELVTSRRNTLPGFTPPPAIHIVKQRG